MLDTIIRMARDRRGSVPVEYVVIAVLLGVAIIGGFSALSVIAGKLQTVSNAIGS